jgi:hypothetical protein
VSRRFRGLDSDVRQEIIEKALSGDRLRQGEEITFTSSIVV